MLCSFWHSVVSEHSSCCLEAKQGGSCADRKWSSLVIVLFFLLWYHRWSSKAPPTWPRASLPLMPWGGETDLRPSRTLGTRPTTWGCSPGSSTTGYGELFMYDVDVKCCSANLELLQIVSLTFCYTSSIRSPALIHSPSVYCIILFVQAALPEWVSN